VQWHLPTNRMASNFAEMVESIASQTPNPRPVARVGGNNRSQTVVLERIKKAAEAAFFGQHENQVPEGVRHEPGKNFMGTLALGAPVPAAGPQSQLATLPPNEGDTQVAIVAAKVASPPALSAVQGASMSAPSTPDPIFCTVTNTRPAVAAVVAESPMVVTDLTNFVPEVADTSQPQPLSAMSVPEAADWIVSVMLVRHADAARMASESLVRLV